VIKKFLLGFAIVCFCAGTGFSLSAKSVRDAGKTQFSLSAGGKMFYNGMFDIETGRSSSVYNDYTYSYPNYSYSNPNSNNVLYNNAFGIAAFVDATYLELGFDFMFGSFKPYKSDNDSSSSGYSYSSSYGDSTSAYEVDSTHFGLSILLKYPFKMQSVSVFPLVGIDCQWFISGKEYRASIKRSDLKNSSGNSVEELTSIYSGNSTGLTSTRKETWFDIITVVAGAGLDYIISDNFYLRSEVTLNFKLPGSREDYLDNQGSGLFSLGPRASIGVGYKFWNKKKS